MSSAFILFQLHDLNTYATNFQLFFSCQGKNGHFNIGVDPLASSWIKVQVRTNIGNNIFYVRSPPEIQISPQSWIHSIPIQLSLPPRYKESEFFLRAREVFNNQVFDTNALMTEDYLRQFSPSHKLEGDNPIVAAGNSGDRPALAMLQDILDEDFEKLMAEDALAAAGPSGVDLPFRLLLKRKLLLNKRLRQHSQGNRSSPLAFEVARSK